jgi:hypothetical protein
LCGKCLGVVLDNMMVARLVQAFYGPPNVDQCVHNSLSLVRILSHFSSVLEIHFNIVFLSLPDISSQFLFEFAYHHATWLSHGGPGSSVGIVTDYGLDGPRFGSLWGRDFPNLSRPALGPTQPPVQRVLGLSRG